MIALALPLHLSLSLSVALALSLLLTPNSRAQLARTTNTYWRFTHEREGEREGCGEEMLLVTRRFTKRIPSIPQWAKIKDHRGTRNRSSLRSCSRSRPTFNPVSPWQLATCKNLTMKSGLELPETYLERFAQFVTKCGQMNSAVQAETSLIYNSVYIVCEEILTGNELCFACRLV